MIVAAFIFLPCAVRAEVFSYTDEAGNVHFVGSEARIPPEYRNKTKAVELPARPAQVPKETSEPDGEPDAADQSRQGRSSLERDNDGHDEQWWRRRMEKLERKKAKIEKALDQLEAEGPIHVRGFYTRKAAHERAQRQEKLEAELARVNEQMAALKEEARRAGAPPGWLR